MGDITKEDLDRIYTLLKKYAIPLANTEYLILTPKGIIGVAKKDDTTT